MTTTTDDELHAYRRAPDLRRLMLRAAMVGIGAILLALIIAVIRGKFHDFFHGYLVAFLMFLGLTLGCIALGLLVSIVGGRWGEVVRPVIAAGAKALPLMAILFLPLLLGLKDTYPWASNKFDHDEVIVHQRHIWLSTGAFVIRAVVYFVIWAVLAGAVVVWSRQRDTLSLRSEELPTDSPLRVITGPGIAVFGITVTFAAIDWVMSVEPRWYSTIFGLSYIAGVALGALAFASLAIVLFTDAGGRVFARVGIRPGGRADGAGGDPARGPLVKPTDFGDLGNLLMTFTMLWAYLNFSQFLIIWAGNMPAEVRYNGYGKESYVWAFIAALFTFVAGAGFAITHGVTTILVHEHSGDYLISYIVLAISFAIESVSLARAVRQVRSESRRWRTTPRRFLRLTADTTVKAVFLEDSAALIGLLLAGARPRPVRSSPATSCGTASPRS